MTTRADALALDRDDPLAWSRDRFVLPEGVTYLDGNSLGAQLREIPTAAEAIVGEWRDDLIGGWTERGWWELPGVLGDRIGRIVGAAPGQVIVCDTTTTNLFKVLSAALGLHPGPEAVLVEESSFPTDRYVVDSVAARTGLAVRVVPRGESVVDHLDEAVAVAVLNHVDFRTAEILDLPSATAAVHDTGGLAVWDLSHSAGVIPIGLDEAGVDFAVGCSYKYLNGGPGAPAHLYVAHRHLDAVAQPIPGWLGHADPFLMSDSYEPATGIRRFLTGTQPMVSMRLLSAALDAYDGVDLDQLRAKSMALTDLFIRLVDERLGGFGYEVVSPREASRRGSQVTLHHADAAAIHDRLVVAGVRGDFRTPSLLRFGFAPLYTTYTEAWDAVDALRVATDH